MIDAAQLENARSLAERFDDEVAHEQTEAFARQSASKLLEAESTGETQDEIRAVIGLLSALWHKRLDYAPDQFLRLRAAEHFQSYATEVRFLESRMARSERSAFEEIITSRVIKRHLRVASRQFRNQKAYTFLLEPEDGRLRFRGRFVVSPSRPRIDQAVQFLQDAGLLDDSGPTDLGVREIDGQ